MLREGDGIVRNGKKVLMTSDNVTAVAAKYGLDLSDVNLVIDKVRGGDFYILVPDNETRREVDELRIMWGAADITEDRPALSRWHPSYKAAFDEYMKDGLAQLD